ncbi:MAG: RNA polymerase sigma-70 factor [Reichenbachiella sp.]|uniref:RNA polymerase sigma factor n=1 Tax=Reichenbachiella sp. TaxID=2184521 RepID=UPI0032656CB3
MSIVEEDKLINKLKNGCHQSFTNLFHLYAKKLYNFAYKYTESHAESEEIVQEVFLKIWNKKDSINPKLSFNAFVITIAKNLIFNKIKKEASRRQYRAQIASSEMITNETENNVIFADLAELANNKVESLPPKRKQIYLLRRDSGLSVKEIAAQLGIAESTVENQMNKAIKTLKSNLSNFS